MILTSFLFSPHARVWNLRVLLLVTLGVSAFLATVFASGVKEALLPSFYLPWDILFPTLCGIFIHHAGFVFNWSFAGLAIVDLILASLEVCGIAAGFFFLWDSSNTFPTLLKFSFVPLVLSLALSIIFRTATIVRGDGRFFHRRFAFLGACTQASPAYTPIAILLNRSVARPLVRGESKTIIVARAFILSCVALGVPIFGIYAMVISPVHASVYTRSVATFAAGDLGGPPEAVTFLMGLFFVGTTSTAPSDFSVNQFTVFGVGMEVNCSVTFQTALVERLVECPSVPWDSLQEGSTISIHLTIPSGYAVNIMPLPQRPAMAPLGALSSNNIQVESLRSVQLQVSSDSVPMIPGSHLFGRLTWIQRETLSRRVLGVPTSSKPVFAAEITGLQTHPSDPTSGPNEATLVLFHPYPFAIKLQQDSLDITPLSGLSTFGGFWTFVEGAFVLFFGANVMYFAFGRRPLSALGLIHIFQRHTLVRRWHNDFPSLRTEGGQPGSESAGIVAFIRERLVDIDQNVEVNNQHDLEAQHSRSNSGSEEGLIESATGYGSGYDVERINLNPLSR